MEFDTLFDITKQPCPWEYSAIGLLVVAGGVICIFLSRGLSFSKRLGPWLMVGFGTAWTIFVFSSTVGEWFKGRRALQEGKASIVEGPVEEFKPMPYEGHADEQMTVGGVRFSYSDYTMTSAFRNTSSHGGPLRRGRYVRIHYLDNSILKLEIRKSANEANP
jgi:hypothetical protein